jgi:hypothetical protein
MYRRVTQPDHLELRTGDLPLLPRRDLGDFFR